LTSPSQLVEDTARSDFATYKPSLLKLLKIIENMLFAPAVYASYLGGVVPNFDSLENRDNTGPDGTEVKFDF